jgi:HEAT repeat protein
MIIIGRPAADINTNHHTRRNAMKRKSFIKSRKKARVYYALTSRALCVIAALAAGFGPLALNAADTKAPGTATPVVTDKNAQKAGADKADKKAVPGKTDTAAKKEKPKTEPVTDEKKAEFIDETLDYGTQEERARAIEKITQIKDPAIKGRVVKKLIDLMKDEEEPELLVKAITVLGELKEGGAVPLMTDKLDHRSEDVRIAAVYGLKGLNGVSAKEKLIEKLKAQNLENTSTYTDALLQTLAEFKAVEIVPFIQESLVKNTTNNSVKESMILFIGTTKARDARDVLLKIYRDEDENEMIRAYAVNSLSKLGMPDVAGDIKEVINSIEALDAKNRKQYHDLHLYSVAALAKLGDKDAIPKLINSLRNNSSQVRLRAISLIKDFKEKRTIDILKYKMKYDQNPKVQAAARSALKEMGVEVTEEKAK